MGRRGGQLPSLSSLVNQGGLICLANGTSLKPALIRPRGCHQLLKLLASTCRGGEGMRLEPSNPGYSLTSR